MKKVVLFDKNYVSLIKKLLGNQVATFWPINLKYSLINLIKACFFKFPISTMIRHLLTPKTYQI